MEHLSGLGAVAYGPHRPSIGISRAARSGGAASLWAEGPNSGLMAVKAKAPGRGPGLLGSTRGAGSGRVDPGGTSPAGPPPRPGHDVTPSRVLLLLPDGSIHQWAGGP
ncbi:MAG: hypothetical protein AB7L09_01835 [Nitrospira sp.]